MFLGSIVDWPRCPKKSPHANKKAEPCKAILLVLAQY
jgi:hypothetical protein